MRIDVTNSEFEILVDCLMGQPLRCYAKQREHLARRLDIQLHPSKAPPSNGWAPINIKSSWPTGHVNPDHKPNWSFHKPRNKKATPPKVAKKSLSADEILAELS